MKFDNKKIKSKNEFWREQWAGSQRVIDSCKEFWWLDGGGQGERVPGLLNLQIYATVQRQFIQLAQLIYTDIYVWKVGVETGDNHCWKYILCSEFRVNNNSLCWTQYGEVTRRLIPNVSMMSDRIPVNQTISGIT